MSVPRETLAALIADTPNVRGAVDHDGWHVTAEFAWLDGRYEPIAVELRAGPGARLTAESVRAYAIGTALQLARASATALDAARADTLATIAEHGDDDERAAAFGDADVGALVAGIESRTLNATRKLSTDELARVAAVYRAAWAANTNPKAAVAAAFGLTESGASKRIAKARRAGALGPVPQGRRGGEVSVTK